MGNGIIKHVDISIIVPLCTETSTIKYCSHRILVRRILAGFPNNSGRPAEISQQKSCCAADLVLCSRPTDLQKLVENVKILGGF